MAERQRIWVARTIDRQPPPWTDDPILRTQRFTNVYRELDPGTRYARWAILEADESAEDRVFNIMIYRLIGRIETHRALGFQRVATFKADSMRKLLLGIRQQGLHPFTGAYMVSGYRSMGSADKIENVCRLFDMLHKRFPQFMLNLRSTETMESAFDVIGSEPGFGRFLAYQCLIDLTYPLAREAKRGILPFSQNEWAAAGPGARKGLRLLLPEGTVDELEAMRWLQKNQSEEFARLGIRFRYLLTREGKPMKLSLANIQNCLCEFYKYAKIRAGIGRSRRRFLPENGHGTLEEKLSPRQSEFH